MPWKVEDVEKHNKGLSAKQKKQWVAVANQVLSKCMAEGGEESKCAASAIQQANGVVKTNEVEMENYSQVSADYQIQSRIYKGSKHLIVPVVMMVEGVHSGSHGPLLHTAEELGKFPASWNGIPVTIGHPSIEGYNVSANSPDILEQAVGRVFNTRMEGNKLKAEVWLNEQKLIAVSPTALSYIQNGRQLDVSIGVFSDEDQTPGVYVNENGEEEQYIAVARNHRPDHLALLPGESGACGWEDGCGIRANSSETINVNTNEDMTDPILIMRQAALDDMLQSITDNKQGFQELIGKISEKLYAKDSPEEYYMLEEVYNDSIVYRKRCQNNAEGTGYYQQTYTINADGSIELDGEPQRVSRTISYVPINTMRRTIFNNNKKEPVMDKPCCLEKVVELLNNKALGFTEAEDREWLLSVGPERLEKMTPKIPEVAEPVQVNMTEYVKRDAIKTFEDVLALAPESVKMQMQAGLKLHEAHRAELVSAILANAEKDAWTEEELKAFDTPMLEKLNKQFKPQVNYAGQAAGADPAVNATDAEEKLLPVIS